MQRQGISAFGHTQPHARIQGLMSQRRARFQSLLPRCPCAGLTLCGGPLCPQALNRYIGLPQGLERVTPPRKEHVGAEILRAGHATLPTPQLAMRHVGVLGPGGRLPGALFPQGPFSPVLRIHLRTALSPFLSQQEFQYAVLSPSPLHRPPKSKRLRTASLTIQR